MGKFWTTNPSIWSHWILLPRHFDNHLEAAAVSLLVNQKMALANEKPQTYPLVCHIQKRRFKVVQGYLKAVWPDWAILKSSLGQIFVQK